MKYVVTRLSKLLQMLSHNSLNTWEMPSPSLNRADTQLTRERLNALLARTPSLPKEKPVQHV